MSTFLIKTFGCKTNQTESAVMEEKLLNKGFALADDLENCDYYIFNSCAVTLEAERKLIQSVKAVKSKNPNIKVLLTGCYAQLHKDEDNILFDKIFGIYEKLLDSILNFFKDIRKNIKFLLPIFIGIGIGVLSFSKILNYLLFQFPIQTKSIFIGLILGSIPSLLKEANCKSNFKFHYIIYTLLAFGIGIGSVILENYIRFIILSI